MEFRVGQVYRRAQIHSVYGGQRQSGICTPRGRPVVILFSGSQGEQYGYRDGWKEDGFFHYTGEGQVGDMEITKGNLAIVKHLEQRKSLLLFSRVTGNQYQFVGRMEYVEHYEEEIPDVRRQLRRGLIFVLRLVEDVAGSDGQDPELARLSLEALRQKAVEAAQEMANKPIRWSLYRERSRAVRTYVLKRAHGFCEGCGLPAPFQRRDGTSYLETHHVHRLSDDGPDAPTEVIALCPTCHRRVHYGHTGEHYNRVLAQIPLAVEVNYTRGRLKYVAAAIILGSQDKILVCQRANGALAGCWEFPGGKVRDDEKPEECVRREIQEELRVVAQDVAPFTMVDHDYGDFAIRLMCFTCTIQGIPVLAEHRASRWVSLTQLERVNLARADEIVARRLLPRGASTVGLPIVADRERAEYSGCGS